MLVRTVVTLVASNALILFTTPWALALNPNRAVTQYTRDVWTQKDGLPQDTVNAITQTKDGYLWLGTDEGLVRFDGYDFVVFNKSSGALPSNSIHALFANSRGDLWIGTPGGLTLYSDGKFRTYSNKDGLPDLLVSSIAEDGSGAVWMTAGLNLARFHNGKFTNYRPRTDLPLQTVRSVYVNRKGQLYVAGLGGVLRLEGGRFIQAVRALDMDAYTLIEDHVGNLWIGGPTGLVMHAPDGSTRLYRTSEGLPDNFVRSVLEDRDGNIWVGTILGLARLTNKRFVNVSLNSQYSDWVRCTYEDTSGNLWVGMNSGLSRFRDSLFMIYGVGEGLPSDAPTNVYQDRRGRIWIGFHDRGLAQIGDHKSLAYSTTDGLPSNDVFSIREDSHGDLLIATRAGPTRMHNGHFFNYSFRDQHHRRTVYDFLEDQHHRLWIGTPEGLEELQTRGSHNVIPITSAVLILCETRDGSIWAGTDGQGLWRLKDGLWRLYTISDGLSNTHIRSLLEDADGTLWIGTIGGGLNALRNGRILAVTTVEDSLGQNIWHIQDDRQGSLWLNSSRGIVRVRKQGLNDVIAGKIGVITPVTYGIADGLRSAQCTPGCGGTQTTDGRLWFTTSRGLAVLDLNERPPLRAAPLMHMVSVTSDGRPVPLSARAQLPPRSGHIEFWYTGIYLSAPEQVRYTYRLEGLDQDWSSTVSRHLNYSSLPHGQYRLVLRGVTPDGQWGETNFAFDVQPHLYETLWFRYIAAGLVAIGIYALLRLRELQMRRSFGLVLEERARLAREIHDTLAQGFVGVSSQLDAVAITLDSQLDVARKHLNLARRMVRHSLTEARRAVMDLRESVLEGQDLPSALSEAADQWITGSPMRLSLDFAGKFEELPPNMEQQLLRIAQEAVANSVKHSQASHVSIRLERQDLRLTLRVRDDGRGFLENSSLWSNASGHFGLLGMRERAKRLGGELVLHSEPGRGTEIEVSVPLS